MIIVRALFCVLDFESVPRGKWLLLGNLGIYRQTLLYFTLGLDILLSFLTKDNGRPFFCWVGFRFFLVSPRIFDPFLVSIPSQHLRHAFSVKTSISSEGWKDVCENRCCRWKVPVRVNYVSWPTGVRQVRDRLSFMRWTENFLLDERFLREQAFVL